MAWPLWDLAGDLAVARGGGPVETDSTNSVDGRYLRRRIAAALWIPLGFGAIALGSAFDSWPIGLAAFGVVIAFTWAFAERGDRIWAAIRRRR